MSRLLAAVTALLLVVGCDPLRDRHGCWVDGDEAYIHLQQALCEVRVRCGGYGKSESTGVEEAVDACVDEYTSASALSSARDSQCFDGCLVDDCVDAWLVYAESCADGDYALAEESCLGDNGPFWDLWSSPNRSCLEDERGW